MTAASRSSPAPAAASGAATRSDSPRAARRIVVNDLGPGGAPPQSALRVAEEIERAGGLAVADGADVCDPAQVEAMVKGAEERWGGVDILVANAGILRDKSFAKMELADFERVVNVHLMGSAISAKAVWAGMRERNYGRIVFTSSASGIYGNFGQANYGAAKAAMIGLMNVLHLEGAKNDIRVNMLAPTAATAMTDGPAAARSRRAADAGIGDARACCSSSARRRPRASFSAPAPASSP